MLGVGEARKAQSLDVGLKYRESDRGDVCGDWLIILDNASY